jgi:hypothetical protein
VVSIDHHKKPDEWDEGFMKIIRLEKNYAYLKNEEGVERGPVMLSKALVKVLNIGDAMNVSIGRYANLWKVLEGGNVYAKDTIF